MMRCYQSLAAACCLRSSQWQMGRGVNFFSSSPLILFKTDIFSPLVSDFVLLNKIKTFTLSQQNLSECKR